MMLGSLDQSLGGRSSGCYTSLQSASWWAIYAHTRGNSLTSHRSLGPCFLSHRWIGARSKRVFSYSRRSAPPCWLPVSCHADFTTQPTFIYLTLFLFYWPSQSTSHSGPPSTSNPVWLSTKCKKWNLYNSGHITYPFHYMLISTRYIAVHYGRIMDEPHSYMVASALECVFALTCITTPLHNLKQPGQCRQEVHIMVKHHENIPQPASKAYVHQCSPEWYKDFALDER